MCVKVDFIESNKAINIGSQQKPIISRLVVLARDKRSRNRVFCFAGTKRAAFFKRAYNGWEKNTIRRPTKR
jgi:hypothetical protein